MLFHQLRQTSSRYFSRLNRVCHTQTLTSTECHISSLHSHFWVQLSAGNAFPQPDKHDKLLRFFNIIIIHCGRTLYVGFAHVVPPTNKKFKPLLLPTQVGLPNTNAHKHRTSYLKLHSIFWGQLSAGVHLCSPTKTGNPCGPSS